MRIDAQLIAHAAAPSAASRPATTARFSLAAGTSREPARANSAAPLATLDAILMLQQEDPGERRRRHAKRGQDLLAALDDLKAALLGGASVGTALRRITDRLGASSGPSGDGALDDVVQQIELRARVELAKLARADAPTIHP
jgi:Flp pilus assembly protein TadB